MSLLTTAERDELRAAILGELAAARTVAFPVETIARRVIRSKLLDFEVSLSAAQAETDALLARGLVNVVTGLVATTPHYQVTAAGILAAERGA